MKLSRIEKINKTIEFVLKQLNDLVVTLITEPTNTTRLKNYSPGYGGSLFLSGACV